MEAAQPGESVLVTKTVYVTAVPGWTAGLWRGDAVMLGAEGVHGAGAGMSIVIAALLLPTDTVVNVMPDTGSVKLLPTSRNASSESGEVVGGHIEEGAAVGLESDARWMKTPVRYRLASQPTGRRSSTKNACPVAPRAIFRALGAVPGSS